MKCVVEVISDSLSKPSPMPVSPECLETLQGDATAETPPKEVVEKREDSDEVQQGGSEGTTEGPRPQAIPEPGQKSSVMGNSHAPGEDAAINTQMPASLPNQDDVDSQATGDSERGLGTQQQAGKAKQEEEEEVREKAEPEEIPTAESSSQPEYEAIQKDEGQSESHAVDGGGKTRASEALSPKGELELSQKEEDREDVMAGPPQGLFPGGKSQELEHQQEEEERLSREWEDKRWSRMDQLAKELTAEKRLQGEDDPDRSMKLSFRARAYGFRDPRPQLRRGWRPSSREESVETRGDFEEKKEEEGSANRRAEDQELESLSAIEAELEKVAHQLQALRRG
ncbi:chromogranin A [Cricetulus griseus]